MSAYQPIDCNLYDYLTMWIMQKEPLHIAFRNHEGRCVELQSRATDVYTKQGEEFLVLSSGQEIRLDLLVSINGVGFENKQCDLI